MDRRLLSLDSVSAAVGVPKDILKLLGLLLLSTPLSIPLANLRSRSIHIYSILCSTVFLLLVFNLTSGWIQLVTSSLATWLTLKIQLNRKNLKSKTPWLIFFGLLGHLTINHARRLFWNVSPDTVEITGSQMVLVMKLSTFAWNVYDGQQPTESLDGYQRSTAIKELPGLLEFFGYCFFFPSLLVGPAIPFSDYSKFTSARDHGLVSPPGRGAHALRKIATGLLFAALVGLYGGQWSYERILEDEFLAKSWLQRLWHLQVAGFMSRARYYLVWSLAEASLAMSGCGYDRIKGDWSGGRNIEIKEIELAQNYKAVFDNWNMKTNIWLRECVYKRVAVMEGNKPGFLSTMATFGASAAWHGPLPAYFVAFISGGFLQALGRSIRGAIRPFFLASSRISKMVYDGLCIIGTQTTLNYLVVPFVLLDIGSTRVVYNRLAWYGHIIAGIPMLILWAGGLERKLRKRHASHIKEQDKKAQVVAKQSKPTTMEPVVVASGNSKTVITATTNPIDGQKTISMTTVIGTKLKST
ncbi:lysophospholipid acyltransferase [Puccinia graminis f. sp. tritici]|uniref:Lysophospholipid acyltransferase n=2 Tax=Puccinia graminis f. sp. tritici TaxID=56615 RepID=A0A5B0S051_PUCGR|nr:lysophospholipid acyltransferase [Puccinia graminis f. sp. tritici]